MPTGTKLKTSQKRKIHDLNDEGLSGYEIAQFMKIGHSTVYRVLQKNQFKRTDYSIGATKEAYDVITNFAEKKGMSRRAALTELLKPITKKHWWNWR